MEIRIYLDGTDPPVGRLRSVRPPDGRPGREVGFTGWLGLLRALYDVTEPPSERPSDVP